MNDWFLTIVLLVVCSMPACAASDEDGSRYLEFLKKRCEASDAQSCFALGKRKLEGIDGERDITSARRYYVKACDKNHAEACQILGLLWKDGNGGPADAHQARRLFRKACDHNHGQGCAELAKAALLQATERDKAEARAALDKACSLGVFKACQTFAVMCAFGAGGKADQAAAWRGFYTACQSGISESCQRLKALSIDPRALMGQSCELGDAKACLFFGKMADEGIFGQKNREEARIFYAAACDAQLPAACTNLGEMWANGIGGASDMEKAKQYFGSACRKEGLKGCANLALLLEWDGDLIRARTLRERACYNGEPSSCARLAWFWSWGWGGKKDAARAEALMGEACQLGNEDSCRAAQGNDR